MTRFLKLCAFIALAVMIVCPAFASTLVGTFGAPDTNGNAPASVDSDGVITLRSSAGLKLAYEKATTNDTITAAESGKTFIVDPATPVTFVLPDADVGINLSFTASDGHADGTQTIILDPQDTDTFRGVVSGDAGTTFAAGDSIKSSGVTGDSVTIFCAEDTYWDVINIRNTWSDAN